uniref:Bestrophin homolog n=1 Tax=Heterorhabditis bacteriophora TaxID=37862 RepID=A0A1I7X207_HETBA
MGKLTIQYNIKESTLQLYIYCAAARCFINLACDMKCGNVGQHNEYSTIRLMQELMVDVLDHYHTRVWIYLFYIMSGFNDDVRLLIKWSIVCSVPDKSVIDKLRYIFLPNIFCWNLVRGSWIRFLKKLVKLESIIRLNMNQLAVTMLLREIWKRVLMLMIAFIGNVSQWISRASSKLCIGKDMFCMEKTLIVSQSAACAMDCTILDRAHTIRIEPLSAEVREQLNL